MTTTSKAVAGTALAAIAVGAALPALTGAQTAPTRDITVRNKVRAVEFVHVKRGARGDRLAQGDRVLTRQALFNESDRGIGTLFTDCVNVGSAAPVFDATLQCTTTYRFSDGQVVAAGIVRLSSARRDPRGTRVPIVGGTGAYSSGRGEVGAGPPARGYDSVDVLRLAG